jgi:cytochrome b561
MHLRSSIGRYGIIAATFHWLIVVGLIAEYILAEAGEHDKGSGAFTAPALHSAIGLLILILAIARLLWRAFDVHPTWPDSMKRRDVVIARSVHALFYGLLFALPLTGWMLASTEGDPISFFGLFNVPTILLGSEDLLEDVHEALFNVLVGLAVLHVLAALKHHFIDKDNVLRSMLLKP